MTDSHDPFAANPYVPPADRRDGPPAPPAPEQSSASSAEQSSASAPDAEPTVEVPRADETASEPAAHDQTHGDQTRTEQTPDQQSSVPDDYTHRFPTTSESAPQPPRSDPFAVASPAPGEHHDHQQTAPLPPFAAHGGSGSGSDGGSTSKADRPRRGGRTLAGVLALAVLAGGAGFGGAWVYDETQGDSGSTGTVVTSLDDKGKTTQTKAPSGSVQAVAEKVLPSVVQINVKGSEESGSGTGIIISSDGNILTNNHVVDVASDGGTITVAFSDGSNARARIVGADPKTDLAVIKAAGQSGLVPASLGSSADLKVGQEVVAIGSPFGLESTVTQGIVSALNRPVSSSDGSGNGESTTFPAVQTDAAINPGNSGGPLVDLSGDVIAINSAIRSGTTVSGEAGSIGLGFAIPIDLAKNVSRQLLDGKKVQHAQIGVQVGNFLSEDGITGVGAEVKDVTPGGAGDKAGLEEGDVITAVNGSLIPSSEALVAAVRGFNPGEKIKVAFTRDGEKDEVEVTLGSDGGRTEQASSPATPRAPR